MALFRRDDECRQIIHRRMICHERGTRSTEHISSDGHPTRKRHRPRSAAVPDAMDAEGMAVREGLVTAEPAVSIGRNHTPATAREWMYGRGSPTV